jgi:hypothetical protein
MGGGTSRDGARFGEARGMTRLMLLGAVRGRPEFIPNPEHRQIFGRDWTGLALELPAALDLDDPESVTELAKIQHNILCQYVVTQDVFPVAMGAVLSGVQSVATHLEHIAPELDQFYIRFGQHVEYTLTAMTAPLHTPEPASSGAAHLQERLVKRDRARQSGKRIGTALQTALQIAKDLGAKHQLRSRQPASPGQKIDLLLDRHSVERFTEQLKPVARAAARQGVQLCLIGPYPAFSFLAGSHDG